MMYKHITILLCLFALSFVEAKAKKPKRGDFRVMFYNVENLFDAKDDKLTRDDDFTPKGKKHWTFQKYKNKINRISQVIMAVGEGRAPEIVGLCEVENKYVLEGITRYTYLAKQKYKIIHYDSPDARGIDVAMLYKEGSFSPLSKEPIHIKLGNSRKITTRDILYVKGITNTDDTLHIFINHWPSKYEGYLKTIPRRNKVARVLRLKTDSILSKNKHSKILIMGDLNTEPSSIPVKKTLGAKTRWNDFSDNVLYNLSATWENMPNYGSHKYHGIWSTIDHFIVSKGMISGKGILFSSKYDAHIFQSAFLLEEDNNGGLKPFRTIIGMRYNGGFSDHLPIYLDLWRD